MKTIKYVLRVYRWKLFALVLALAVFIITRGIIAREPEPPPGGVPIPDIDPL